MRELGYSLRPAISGYSPWLWQCRVGSCWLRSPANSAERTKIFFKKNMKHWKLVREVKKKNKKRRGKSGGGFLPMIQQVLQNYLQEGSVLNQAAPTAIPDHIRPRVKIIQSRAFKFSIITLNGLDSCQPGRGLESLQYSLEIYR